MTDRGAEKCGFCEDGKPLDTQEDWDRSWGRIWPASEAPKVCRYCSPMSGAEWPVCDRFEGDGTCDRCGWVEARHPPARVGRCHWCGDGVLTDQEHVQVSSLHYHQGCAERLLSELQAVL